jgi:thiamine-monophosphate kinase
MIDIANRFDVAIVGGNIASADKVNITVSLIGSLKGNTPLLRSAAAAGDLIVMTGYTGLAAAGLRMLKHKLKLNAESAKILKEAHLKPMPRVKEGQTLLKSGLKSAIDISDGLVADLAHVCKASKASATINTGLLPIHPILKTHFPKDCEQLALAGGEDYELLFTASKQIMEKVKQSISCPVTVIGEITKGTPGKVKVVDSAGKTLDWQKAGWEHFKSRL